MWIPNLFPPRKDLLVGKGIQSTVYPSKHASALGKWARDCFQEVSGQIHLGKIHSSLFCQFGSEGAQRHTRAPLPTDCWQEVNGSDVTVTWTCCLPRRRCIKLTFKKICLFSLPTFVWLADFESAGPPGKLQSGRLVSRAPSEVRGTLLHMV